MLTLPWNAAEILASPPIVPPSLLMMDMSSALPGAVVRSPPTLRPMLAFDPMEPPGEPEMSLSLKM